MGKALPASADFGVKNETLKGRLKKALGEEDSM